MQALLVIQVVQAIQVVLDHQEHQAFQILQHSNQDQLVLLQQLQLVVDQVQVRLSFRGQDSKIYN